MKLSGLKGKIVYVEALDHASFAYIDDLVEIKDSDYFVAVGILYDYDEHYIYLVSHFHKNAKEGEGQLAGVKILRRNIVKIEVR